MNKSRRGVRCAVTFLMVAATLAWFSVKAYHAIWGFTVSAEGGLLGGLASVAALGFLEALIYLVTRQPWFEG
jgi:hypothetical protein